MGERGANVRSRRGAGLTMIETALLVSVVGIVLAVAVPTFMKNLRTSKVSEATSMLARLHARTASYYQASHRTSAGLALRCLPEAAGPAPTEPSQEPAPVDFGDESTPGHRTWEALDFQPERPLRYSYTFEPSMTGCGQLPTGERPALVLRAEGDLDADGTRSTFERTARIDEQHELSPGPLLRVTNRIE